MSRVRLPLSDIKFHDVPVVGQFYTKKEVDQLIKERQVLILSMILRKEFLVLLKKETGLMATTELRPALTSI